MRHFNQVTCVLSLFCTFDRGIVAMLTKSYNLREDVTKQCAFRAWLKLPIPADKPYNCEQRSAFPGSILLNSLPELGDCYKSFKDAQHL